MTAPALAAARFAVGCLMGAGLGILYGFLRPLRPRLTWLADTVFVLCTLWAWLVLSFAVCRGEVRPGISAALFLGAFLLDRTLGRLLAPIFRWFWKLLGSLFGVIFLPIRKFFQKTGEISKKVFASWKKRGTIE